jgi:hypothetical protein
MITNLNIIKWNQTPRRGQLSYIKRRIPKAKPKRKVGTYGRGK